MLEKPPTWVAAAVQQPPFRLHSVARQSGEASLGRSDLLSQQLQQTEARAGPPGSLHLPPPGLERLDHMGEGSWALSLSLPGLFNMAAPGRRTCYRKALAPQVSL